MTGALLGETTKTITIVYGLPEITGIAFDQASITVNAGETVLLPNINANAGEILNLTVADCTNLYDVQNAPVITDNYSPVSNDTVTCEITSYPGYSIEGGSQTATLSVNVNIAGPTILVNGQAPGNVVINSINTLSLSNGDGCGAPWTITGEGSVSGNTFTASSNAGKTTTITCSEPPGISSVAVNSILPPMVCGQYGKQAGEECDNGKHCENGNTCNVDNDCTVGDCLTRDGDGCSVNCTIESGYVCGTVTFGGSSLSSCYSYTDLCNYYNAGSGECWVVGSAGQSCTDACHSKVYSTNPLKGLECKGGYDANGNPNADGTYGDWNVPTDELCTSIVGGVVSGASQYDVAPYMSGDSCRERDINTTPNQNCESPGVFSVAGQNYDVQRFCLCEE